MGKDMGIWLRHHDVIGHVRKLKKSYHSTNLLNNRLQKELGRFVFPVFLEKRKSKPHLKKYPPEQSLDCIFHSWPNFNIDSEHNFFISALFWVFFMVLSGLIFGRWQWIYFKKRDVNGYSGKRKIVKENTLF